MHDVFTELALIIAIGSGIALVMRILKQPLIIGHIFTGIIVGPSAFGLVQSAETIEVFSKIGIALLLFIIGLGLNPRIVREVGKVAGLAGLVQMLVTATAGWMLGTLYGFTRIEAIILGTALSFSSTIIILKVLSDKKEQSRLYGKITIGILLIQDIVATFALLIFTAQSGQDGFSASQLLILLGKGMGIGIPLVLIGSHVLPRLRNLIAGSQEFLFLFSIGWGFGSAALFEVAGFSLEVGALFAGVSLATLPYAQEISARLRPLRDFFVVVFFINLGATLSFGSVIELLPIIIACLGVVVVLKPMVASAMMGVLGYTKRTSFKSGIALAQISEFSLVLATLAADKEKAGAELVTTLTMVALITIAVSTYGMMFSEGLFTFFDKHLHMFESSRAKFEQKESRKHYELVLFGYQRGGHEFVKVFKSLKKRFVVVDYDPEAIDSLEKTGVDYLYGDATDKELLDEIELERAKLIVSTITDFESNKLLLQFIEKINPNAVIIVHADSVEEAGALYEMGAAYVMMPHYIGSEKIGAFIKKSGFKKTEFRKFRDKHLAYLQSHYSVDSPTETTV